MSCAIFIIGAGAGKFLVVRMIFAQTSLNLPEKSSKENDLQKIKKKLLHFFSCWVHFLKSKHTSSTIFAQISTNLPEINKKNMTSKKTSAVWFGCHFHKIKAYNTAILRCFSQILPIFPQILPGFSPNQTFWGCACIPVFPPPTPVF